MITKADLDARLRSILEESEPLTPESLDATLKDHLRYGIEHLPELAPDAKAAIEGVLDSLLEEAAKAALALEDSPSKRERLRTVARLRGDHYSVARILEGICEQPMDLQPYLKTTETSTLAILQDASDVMYDTRAGSPGGQGAFLVSALFAGAIDDCLCGLLLLRKGLANQVATLLRAAQEKLELAELFLRSPEYVEVWMDEKRRWKELKPSKVRSLLGRPDDIGYKYLSEAGAHPTFLSITQRTAKHTTTEGSETSVRIWVGGQPLIWAMIPLCVAAIGHASQILLLAIQCMQQTRTVPENHGRVAQAERLMAEFERDYAVPKMRDMGIPGADL